MGKQVAAGYFWGRSSVGRAPALQAGGREFESHRLHCGCKSAIQKFHKNANTRFVRYAFLQWLTQ